VSDFVCRQLWESSTLRFDSICPVCTCTPQFNRVKTIIDASVSTFVPVHDKWLPFLSISRIRVCSTANWIEKITLASFSLHKFSRGPCDFDDLAERCQLSSGNINFRHGLCFFLGKSFFRYREFTVLDLGVLNIFRSFLSKLKSLYKYLVTNQSWITFSVKLNA